MTRPAGSRSVPLFSPQALAVLNRPLRLTGSSLPPSDQETTDERGSDRIEVSGSELEEGKGVASECNACHVTFDDRAEQVAHYRLDWHRYNLKRRLRGLPHMTQTNFEEEAGDLSSISGSESDSEDSEEAVKTTPTDSTHQSSSSPFVHFSAGDSEALYSVYRVILTGGKEYRWNDLLPSILSLSLPPLWVILMRAGDHFAGAVFNGSSVVAHKTFHRYTVRAKRGTSQSARDSQSGGHGPKSAGATLRRYNELALEREVQGLLQSWAAHLREASAIFIRAPKTHLSMFTGGRTPLVSRDDPRVRGIPFTTRRPTLKEVKRVHSCLASLYLHGNVPRRAVNVETVSLATPREMVEVESVVKDSSDGGRDCEDCEEVGSEGEDDSGEGAQREAEGRRKKMRKRRKKLEKPWNEMSLPPVLGQLLAACERRGGAEEVEDLLQTLGLHPIYSTLETTPTANETTGQVSGQPAAMSDVLNKLYGGVSPLHVASEGGHSDLVKVLLEHGADPTLQDSGGRVPYLVAREKSVRDCYRRFMGQWPKTHDYSLAQIPSPLTDQLERERREKAAEKKREKKRQAKKKKSEENARKEEEEVVRRQGEALQGLSEREKRALAAERRLAGQKSSDSSVQRAGACSCCGRGLAGLVPFHRLQYHYCSMPCVKEHRTRLEKS